MKAKLKGAETGHSLLKRKSEALTKYVVLLLFVSSMAFSLTRLYADVFEVREAQFVYGFMTAIDMTPI